MGVDPSSLGSGPSRSGPNATLGFLVLRHLRVFFHNRNAVILVGGAPLVLFLLFLVIIRPQMATWFSATTGVSLIVPDDLAAAFSAWVFASVAVISAVSSTAGFLLAWIDDKKNDRFELQLASGVRDWQLTGGYLLAAVVVSTGVSYGVIVLGQIWALIAGQPLMPLMGWLASLGAVLLAAVLFTGLNGFALTFTGSVRAVGVYLVLMVVVIVFLANCLLNPVPGAELRLANLLPFAQAAALVRQPVVAPGLQPFRDPVLAQVRSFLSARIQVGDGRVWPVPVVVASLLVWSTLFLTMAWMRLSQAVRRR